MREQISSRMTFVMRYVIVPWLVLASLAPVVGIAIAVSPWIAVALLLIVLPIDWLLVSTAVSCQRVIATDATLLIGEGERAVPYTAIAKVSTSRVSRPEVVTVDLSSGERIRFFAQYRIHFFDEHPIAAELRARAGGS